MTDTRTAQEMVERLRRGASHNGHSSDWWVSFCATLHEAATLIASLSEEKDNLSCNLDAIRSGHSDTLAMLVEANAERRQFKARALAAKAALAKAVEDEREACARIVEGGQETTTNTDAGTQHILSPRRSDNISGLAYAAAIRERGGKG